MNKSRVGAGAFIEIAMTSRTEWINEGVRHRQRKWRPVASGHSQIGNSTLVVVNWVCYGLYVTDL